ncbi:D-allulose 6-phosphate 3-epimerase [Actinotalea fermentans]|uniref:Allulose-6-phosphate 3-epimerase n=1 Tax=Actinotalea fermentans TaxID=43671 RepID=A0A511YZL1_9CELL|nr:D-allulose 6-phosphate 3-epimerase [Actinotalea fermentans]KGM17076.1 hypothetical protein N867_10285 [Actinotalea fermentans ATCC 43279 = JCM 9966 = DSM 3133]GEN80635.1 allulose-6-phosphate 3-epimerase [Actinotalea fermentans]
MSTPKFPAFSVSVMCMDLLRVGEQLEVLDRHADALHADVMDGHFARNIAMSPDFVKALCDQSALPVEAHLMTEHPGDWLEILAEAGASTLSMHAETVERDAFRLLDRVSGLGCRTGIVLNPATPLTAAQHYLDRVDLLTIMTVDVGYAGQPFIEQMLTKIEAAAAFKREHGLHYQLQIDGSCNAATYARLVDAGAEAFVLGSTGLFNLDADLERAWLAAESAFTASTGVERA